VFAGNVSSGRNLAFAAATGVSSGCRAHGRERCTAMNKCRAAVVVTAILVGAFTTTPPAAIVDAAAVADRTAFEAATTSFHQALCANHLENSAVVTHDRSRKWRRQSGSPSKRGTA
jgi:hypothetical protein